MKTRIKISLLPASIILISLLVACAEKEDYSHIIFKNYLTYEINRATNFLESATEGDAEGEYKAGSRQAYQSVIDGARLVDEKATADQEEIDLAYQNLLDADAHFFDQMVPYRSVFQELIAYAGVVLANTEEGEQEGNVKPGNKSLLEGAVGDANALVSLNDLTQRMLDEGTVELNNAIYFFNGEIIGRATTALVNPAFELPGYETNDFGAVDGWSTFGKVEEWAPLASVVAMETAPEGDYVARFGSYTQGVYQQVEEIIHPNADYTLEFELSLLSNDPDWQGKKYPAILRTRMIVFEQEVGNFSFITVLSESFDTLGIKPGDFAPFSHSVTIDAVSPSIGKKVAVDFVQRHTWDTENPIWAQSFVALDHIRLYRKLQ